MLYCVRHPYEPLYKVGFTCNVARRMAEYKSHGMPVKPLFVRSGTRDDEKRVHAALAPARAYGEWFRCSREAVQLAMQ